MILFSSGSKISAADPCFMGVKSMADSYLVIESMIKSNLAAPLLGWKVGATSAGAQKMLGISTPFYAPLFTTDVLDFRPQDCTQAVHFFF